MKSAIITAGFIALLTSCRTSSTSTVESTPTKAAALNGSHVCTTQVPNTFMQYEIRIAPPNPKITMVKYGPNDFDMQIRDRNKSYYVEVVQGNVGPTDMNQIQYTGPLNLKLQLSKSTGESPFTGKVTVKNADGLNLNNIKVNCN